MPELRQLPLLANPHREQQIVGGNRVAIVPAEALPHAESGLHATVGEEAPLVVFEGRDRFGEDWIGVTDRREAAEANADHLFARVSEGVEPAAEHRRGLARCYDEALGARGARRLP